MESGRGPQFKFTKKCIDELWYQLGARLIEYKFTPFDEEELFQYLQLGLSRPPVKIPGSISMPSSSTGSAAFLSFREFQHMVLHIHAFMQSTNLNPTSVNIKPVLHNQIGYVVEVGYSILSLV